LEKFLEKRRTLFSLLLATTVGMVLTLALLLGGEWLLRLGYKDVFQMNESITYLLIGIEGLCVGCVLGYLVGYYPSLEGFLSSLVVFFRLLVRDEFQLSMDNSIEFLLKFEAHFAALYFSAFVLFLARGGGVKYPYFIGMRYLRTKMITAISVAGVALGVAAMVVVLSVMSGFELDLKKKIVGTNAHAILQKRGLDFSNYQAQIDKIMRIPGVVAATPFIYNEVMVSSDYNSAGVFVKGIEPQTAGAVTNFDKSIVEGNVELLKHPEKIEDYLEQQRKQIISSSLPEQEREKVKDVEAIDDQLPQPEKQPDIDDDEEDVPEPFAIIAKPAKPQGIFIGKELKKILKVRLGDQINIVSPLSEELGPSGPIPKARAFKVAGVFYTGMYEYDAKSIYITIDAAQEFFGMGDTISGIGLKFDDIDRAGVLCDKILSDLEGYPYFTRTWYEMNKNLFTALKMEKIGIFILVVIVTLVSAFGIISTLIMMVWEKIKEIAILKSMGATGDGVMKIFMLEGITIGMVGTLTGLLIGLGVCLILKSTEFQLDPDVYYIENLPVNMDFYEFILIAAIALHISFIATIYPSRRASRFRPVEGLRYE
jgi:lipoprotein-releasing system permease protein